jgi:hypothetical protein
MNAFKQISSKRDSSHDCCCDVVLPEPSDRLHFYVGEETEINQPELFDCIAFVRWGEEVERKGYARLRPATSAALGFHPIWRAVDLRSGPRSVMYHSGKV